MDIYWWLDSIIVPLSCATIGALAGYFGCKFKYINKSKNKKIAKDISIAGDSIINSDGSEIKK